MRDDDITNEQLFTLSDFDDIDVQISVVLGTTIMTLGDVLKLKKGDTIELKCSIDTPVDICVNGKVIGRGTIVVLDDNSIGVTLIEIVHSKSR